MVLSLVNPPKSVDVLVARVDHDQVLFPDPVVEPARRDDEHLEAHLGP